MNFNLHGFFHGFFYGFSIREQDNLKLIVPTSSLQSIFGATHGTYYISALNFSAFRSSPLLNRDHSNDVTANHAFAN